jgi:hypothetical protein
VRFPNARHLIGRADWEGSPQHANADSDLTPLVGGPFPLSGGGYAAAIASARLTPSHFWLVSA